jgi:hypothetical protein
MADRPPLGAVRVVVAAVALVAASAVAVLASLSYSCLLPWFTSQEIVTGGFELESELILVTVQVGVLGMGILQYGYGGYQYGLTQTGGRATGRPQCRQFPQWSQRSQFAQAPHDLQSLCFIVFTSRSLRSNLVEQVRVKVQRVPLPALLCDKFLQRVPNIRETRQAFRRFLRQIVYDFPRIFGGLTVGHNQLLQEPSQRNGGQDCRPCDA